MWVFWSYSTGTGVTVSVLLTRILREACRSVCVRVCVCVWRGCWQVAWYRPGLNELNMSTNRPILHLPPPPFSRDLPWPQTPYRHKLTHSLHLPSWCSQIEPKHFLLTTIHSLEACWECRVIYSQPATVEQHRSEQDTRCDANLWQNCSKASEPTEPSQTTQSLLHNSKTTSLCCLLSRSSSLYDFFAHIINNNYYYY